ncbi:hypothetical protein L6164_008593 [Bauhinia variegata]|uniref:Uncharacterized protein n=1 Tax=Bauhinia variegata TaxID=167791 RepID=A0ACB9PH44_BAUVA|nr:hypothetical protein L6164_008593 [Bauhinia variegata]
MAHDLTLFRRLDGSHTSKVKIGNKDFIEVKGKGSVAINTDSGIKLIHDVLYVSEIKQNLLSVPQLVGKKKILCTLKTKLVEFVMLVVNSEQEKAEAKFSTEADDNSTTRAANQENLADEAKVKGVNIVQFSSQNQTAENQTKDLQEPNSSLKNQSLELSPMELEDEEENM